MSERKSNIIIEKLKEGWTDMPSLIALTGWTATSVRGSISTESRKRKLAVERRRIDGITSYRIVYDAIDDINKSVAEGFQSIKERQAAGGPGWEPN